MSAGISAALSMARPAVPAPVGAIALVRTRVIGGRDLWDSDPEATSEAMRLAGALLSRLLGDHRGYEVRSDGDGMLLAFPDALTAARWCMDAQEALQRAEWPARLLACANAAELRDEEGKLLARGLRIGMGVHYGEPEATFDPRTERTDYAGDDLAWVRKVTEISQGGQIVLTAEAWASVEEVGAGLLDADVQDLGCHRFAGREEAARLYQILPWSLSNRTFDSLQTGVELRTNLPDDPGLFIGRDRLLLAVERYFQKGRRVVVLKGTGGIGKTRLALRYAGMHVHEYRGAGGVWFCDLSDARSIDGICHAVARALGISLRSRSMQATQQLGQALAARGRCLLVLDNFEQITRYAQFTVGLWARKAPRLRMLVTSRHRLRVEGEAVVELTPLDSEEAAELFCAKVEGLRPDLEVHPEDPHVQQIVSDLQCLPLAIELAAAWIAVLSVEGIARRVGDGLRALEGVDVDVEPRHETLTQVLRTSWSLLAPYEQDALISCAVFRGGFTPQAALEVIDLSRFRRAPPPMVVLRSLRDKSLLFTYEPPGAPGQVRWNLYDATREFAEEKLVATGLRPTLERRHADFFLDFARPHAIRLRTPGAAEILTAMEVELANLLAVHERFCERAPLLAIEASLAVDPLLAAHGPFERHLEVLEQTVLAASNIKGAHQVPVRIAQVEALLRRGRYPNAHEAIVKAMDCLGPAEEPDLVAWSKAVFGWVQVQRGDTDLGLAALQEAHAVLSQFPDHPHTAIAAFRLGQVHLHAGHLEEAEQVLGACERAAEKKADPWLRADVMPALGDLARHRGHPNAGRAHYQQGLELAEELGDRPRQGRLLTRLGSVALDLRESEAAAEAFDRARAHAVAVGDVVEVALIDGNIARMRHHEGRGHEAEAIYSSAIDALKEAEATRWVGVFRGVLGALRHEQGRLDEARETYLESAKILEQCADRRFAGLVRARLGALHADRGDTSAAGASFAKAEAHLKAVSDPLGLRALDVHRGHVDLARARAGDASGRKKARARFKSATTPTREGDKLIQPAAAISNDVRLALRLLRRCMEISSS